MRGMRIGICGLIVFSVAAHGAVEDWALAVVETCAAALLILWAVGVFSDEESAVRVPPLLLPLAAFTGVALLQIIVRVTASPFATRMEIQKLAAYMIIVFLAGQSYRTAEEWRGFLWFLMVLGFAVSVFGILQHLTFNGKLYWFREMRYGGIPFGPYVNRNHFAGFAELVIPAGLVPLVLGKVRQERRTLAGLFCLLPITALFLCASRGGIVSFFVELGLLGLLVWAYRDKKAPLVASAAVLLLSGALVAWLGVGQTLERFSRFQPLEVTQSKRVSMARDTWRIFLDHPLAGTGLGTLQTVFPKYESLYDGKVVNHTHNDYLEVLAETGVGGGLCSAWFLAILAGAGLKNIRRADNSLAAVLHMVGLVACGGILTHSLVDFNLHIPSNAMLFFLMASLTTASLPAVARRRYAPPHRVGTSAIP